MKLIIDISDEYYKVLKNIEPNKLLSEVHRAIRQGVPVERVIEIERAKEKDKPRKWINWTDDYKDYCKCPVCAYGEEGEVLLKDKTPYCPVCGTNLKG